MRVAELERKLFELEERKAELLAELKNAENLMQRRDMEEWQWRETLVELADYIGEGELENLGLAQKLK